jgi:hypothetical protein
MQRRKSFIFKTHDNETMNWLVLQTGFTQSDLIRISLRLLRDAIIFDRLGKYESIFAGIKDINELDNLVQGHGDTQIRWKTNDLCDDKDT